MALSPGKYVSLPQRTDLRRQTIAETVNRIHADIFFEAGLL
jgi:hypothetical protein